MLPVEWSYLEEEREENKKISYLNSYYCAKISAILVRLEQEFVRTQVKSIAINPIVDTHFIEETLQKPWHSNKQHYRAIISPF